jgi:hypothetical protein
MLPVLRLGRPREIEICFWGIMILSREGEEEVAGWSVYFLFPSPHFFLYSTLLYVREGTEDRKQKTDD